MSKLEVYIKDPDIADPDKKVKTMQSDVVYMCGMTRDEEGGCKCSSLYFGKGVSPSTASGAIADSIVNVFREASQGIYCWNSRCCTTYTTRSIQDLTKF